MDKLNPYNKTLNHELNEAIIFSKVPIVFWIVLVYIGALILQNIQSPMIIPSLIFTIILAVHTLLYFLLSQLNNKWNWFYFVVQTCILFISAFILPKGSPIVLIGLLPVLVAQSIVILKSKIKVLIFFMLSYGLYCIAIVVSYGASELPIFIPIFFLISLIVIFYTIIYNRQVYARLRMEFYLEQLELAYKKVEDLTLINERQRMARDLHDTLAQGLAGLIMQLEAVNVHMKNGNVRRSNEIIENSMQQARETLREARTVIDNLRTESLGDTDFHSAVLNEIKKLKERIGIQVKTVISPIHSLPTLTMEYCLFILRESLANIMKHSQATEVKVKIEQKDGKLYMLISDDGVGFNTKNIGKQTGKYGLTGLQERVRLVGGRLTIESKPGKGTEIVTIVPV
jgi:two-component system, NarL family, sensor histidine kinase YdfH